MLLAHMKRNLKLLNIKIVAYNNDDKSDDQHKNVLKAFVYESELPLTAEDRINGVVLEIDEWQHEKYNVISCLNLLDRCDNPLQLLQEMKNSLHKDGQLIIAVVLPYKPYFEFGKSNHTPAEILPIAGVTFEEQINSLVTDVFQPAGFEVEKWTRVPYLCEGDLNQSLYWLDDAVFVLKSKS